MARLYVTEQGSRIHVERGRLIVEHDGRILASYHRRHVDAISVVGRVSVSAPVIQHGLKGFCDIAFFSAFVGLGIANRTNPQSHKRWMVLATVALLGAACSSDDSSGGDDAGGDTTASSAPAPVEDSRFTGTEAFCAPADGEPAEAPTASDDGITADSISLAQVRLMLEDLEEIGFAPVDLTGWKRHEDGEAPAEFPAFDDGIETVYLCPRCSYEWSGRPE